ncbi:MAG: fumarylacetoacetase [Bacteroidales bacterium]|nr:fumarylacetoacetase [Bacteroidales bacterium]
MTYVVDPKIKSWIEVPPNSDFPIQNIPFGVIKLKNGKIRCATRIGNYGIDLYALAKRGYFKDLEFSAKVFKKPDLNDFISLGKNVHRAVRQRIVDLFKQDSQQIRDDAEIKSKILYHITDVEPQMPVTVGDYTDFYSSKEHATNVGIMFRDPENALFPNWKHLPVGYHGRSSSIVVSGTNIHRPMGQTKGDQDEVPSFGPSRLFDFELESAFVIGKSTQLGDSVSIEEAEEYIFGMVLFNDLSARDIQKWEYVPLGPFLGKNFGSVISPWIVTLDALEPFRTASPEQNPEVLPYLKYNGNKSFDINLEVYIKPEGGDENLICRSNFKYLYWNMAQQLAHHTVNGCNIKVGDMMASGTISGPDATAFGSMLELSWKGTKPLKLSDGSERKFLQDMDTVVMRGYATKENMRIGFGDCITQVLPVKK